LNLSRADGEFEIGTAAGGTCAVARVARTAPESVELFSAKHLDDGPVAILLEAGKDPNRIQSMAANFTGSMKKVGGRSRTNEPVFRMRRNQLNLLESENRVRKRTLDARLQ